VGDVVGGGGAGETPAEHVDEEVVEEDVDEERAEADVGGHGDLALRLEELAGAEVDGHGVDGRDDVDGEPGGLARDVGVLAEEQEQRLGEDEEGRHDDAGGDEDEPGPLEVDAEHGDLAGAEGLAAERLERAAHAEEEAEGEGGEDGEADGGRRQREVAEVADEHLGDGADGVHAEHAHGDGQADAPEALGLVPDHARGVPRGAHRRGVVLVGGLPAAEERRPLDGAGVAPHRSSPPGAAGARARDATRGAWGVGVRVRTLPVSSPLHLLRSLARSQPHLATAPARLHLRHGFRCS